MPIGSIISQPTLNSIHAAYRPIVLKVSATKTNGDPVPPVVYCDIYFADVYYKTVSKTQYEALGAGNSQWLFDIQDAVQEYLRHFLETNGESLIKEAPFTVVKISCKFRSSGIDIDGFIEPEGTKPVQATSSTEAVAGSGTESNVFYGVNATLQHEDNQDLADHLDSFKTGTWDATTHPLSHRPNPYYLCEEDSDSFPIISDQVPSSLVLHYVKKDNTTGNSDFDIPCEAVEILTNLTLFPAPDGEVDEAYFYTFFISGTGPITLSDIVKPAWMTIEVISNNRVLFGGTPTESATGVAVSFTLNNCTDETVAFSTTIDVVEPTSCDPVEIDGDPVFPDAVAGEAYSYDINLSGSTPYALQVIAKPNWMTISLVGDTVSFTGTPSNAYVGFNQLVEIKVTNACGEETLQRIFNVLGPAKNVYIINNTGNDIILSTANGTFTFETGGILPVGLDGFFTIQGMTGDWTVKSLSSMPLGVIDTWALASQGNVLQLTDVSSTNYLWFNPS